MTDLPLVRLQEGRERRVRNGHPWIYSNEIQMTPAVKALPPGGLVRVEDAQGTALGTFGFNPHTLIAARVMSRDPRVTVDTGLLATRLRRALDLRQRLFPTPHYRLIHAEADGFPGLVVDRYGDILSVQLNTAMMEALRAPLLAALREVVQPRAIVLRNDSPSRTLEGLELGSETAFAEDGVDLTQPVEILENGGRFLVDVLEGQKTGWFYDQRDNRAAAARMAGGGRVLDVYTYAGGFGVQAGLAGATQIVLVDRSRPALDRGLAAAELNGVKNVSAMQGDGVFVMDQLAGDKERFDLVIADPPAFVKSKKDLNVGLRGYRKMIRAAASVVAPGGSLLVASCSHAVDMEAFTNEMRAGLAKAGRSGRILRQAGAGADHPVHPFLPESAYLKAILLQLD
ncbi:class I SAM-dependent rRNA methyltransferase [Elstera cyanobacteriorum]|uniref:RlmI/RlmK family 23S rRNA methyltransferase n=1 Tax=Elstera cyanobacteriorum TaxID=2022747 RepID=A0A255XMP5_9PROT|nr:class I SAM-dependent rRNA methyltransferase [Elstera cyanobacteriorum]OYQ18239.1 RlmI/RlmK family 23S rRNA methyltransferase [Elstera cyanobacteriorum]